MVNGRFQVLEVYSILRYVTVLVSPTILLHFAVFVRAVHYSRAKKDSRRSSRQRRSLLYCSRGVNTVYQHWDLFQTNPSWHKHYLFRLDLVINLLCAVINRTACCTPGYKSVFNFITLLHVFLWYYKSSQQYKAENDGWNERKLSSSFFNHVFQRSK